jgi:hypothetical protein
MTHMENNTGDTDYQPDLVGVRHEVFRKIGRNVVQFQELERLLKLLASACRVSASVSGFQAAWATRVASFRKQTLGQVARPLLEQLHDSAEPASSAPPQLSEPWITFSLQIESDAQTRAADERSLATLVKERNQLVHHLLERWNPNDIASCRRVSVELDEQRARIVLEIEKHQAYVRGIREHAVDLQLGLEENDKIVEAPPDGNQQR